MTDIVDSFDRANGALIGSTPSGGGAEVWQGQTAWVISSNEALKNAGSTTWLAAYIEANTSAVRLTGVPGTFVGGRLLSLVGRYVDTNNYWLLQIEPTFMKVFKVVSGTFTQIGSTATTTIASGDVMTYEIDSGNTWVGKKNGTTILTATADSAHSTATKHGFTQYNTGNSFASFAVTDLAVAGGTVGLATETDTALSLPRIQIRATGLATEADTALALSARQVAAVGLATETDTALARTATLIRPAGLATEADTALALAPGAAPGTVGVAVETDQALALQARQIRAVGLAVETDTALALSPGSGALVGMALEIDTAFARPALQRRAVGLAVETDTALALLPAGAVEYLGQPQFTRTLTATVTRRIGDTIGATTRRIGQDTL